MDKLDKYEFEFFGKPKDSMPKRIFFQMLRYLLAGFFLYITYLGFTWRNIPGPPASQPPAAQTQPAAKSTSPPAK